MPLEGWLAYRPPNNLLPLIAENFAPPFVPMVLAPEGTDNFFPFIHEPQLPTDDFSKSRQI
jgi:hypothetical protein